MQNLQSPLSNRNGDQAWLSEAVLDRRLERVRAAHLGINHYQPNCPVHHDRERDQQCETGQQPSLAKGIRLPDDASATVQLLA